MPDREPLPPGILPNIFDTDPPPLHPTTVVGDGVVYVDPDRLKAPETRANRAAHAPAHGAHESKQ